MFVYSKKEFSTTVYIGNKKTAEQNGYVDITEEEFEKLKNHDLHWVDKEVKETVTETIFEELEEEVEVYDYEKPIFDEDGNLINYETKKEVVTKLIPKEVEKEVTNVIRVLEHYKKSSYELEVEAIEKKQKFLYDIRKKREKLFVALNAYASMLSIGAIKVDEERQKEILKWYQAILDVTEEDADISVLYEIPKEVGYYIL